MMTLRQLRYLVAVADTRHFGRAAQSVNVSQPSLSQQIATLEARLGAPLIERRSGGADLTPVGREIVERARSILSAVDELNRVAVRAQSGAIGVMRLGTTPTLGPYLLSEVISSPLIKKTGVRLFIREGIPDEQAAELSRGDLDLLLGPFPLDGVNLESEPLFREPLRLVAAADHPLAQLPALSVADLSGAGVLTLDPRHHFHREVRLLCAKFGMRLLRDYEGTSLDSLRQMAGTQLGLTVLPELYLRSEVGGTAGVRVLDVQGWSATRSIGLFWRQRAAFEPFFRNLGEQIQQIAATIMAPAPPAATEGQSEPDR